MQTVKLRVKIKLHTCTLYMHEATILYRHVYIRRVKFWHKNTHTSSKGKDSTLLIIYIYIYFINYLIVFFTNHIINVTICVKTLHCKIIYLKCTKELIWSMSNIVYYYPWNVKPNTFFISFKIIFTPRFPMLSQTFGPDCIWKILHLTRMSQEPSLSSLSHIY